ncbi:hypothetical protein E4P40_23935 [Blastococcus sp. CT_GayMR20]|uniref:hypothetical protein n=1 Tax=Blastococcus sp. CT_GayMR20 TaxID=2559609 RepID=UPI001073D459|nr:hypothetical protein [Blastococcus sp. CT_GayMR20]TFV67951.1 hypothetical protein E4P40_23935 [Blastococcus sp. CT_GayMR20]
MYALCIEIDVTSIDSDAARRLPEELLARAPGLDVRGEVWVTVDGDEAVGLLLFESEEGARAAAGHYVVGQQVAAPTSGATIRSVRVGSVVAQR